MLIRVKKIAVATVIMFSTINISTAQAVPQRVNCENIKVAQVVTLDCSDANKNPKPEAINTKEPRRVYPGSSRGIFQELKEDIQALINRAAQKVGLSPALVGAVAQVESGGNPKAISPVGAIGVMQLMPGTAAGLGVNPYDPEQNIYGGALYLRYQVDRFGDIPKALAAYNAGPGAVEKYGGIPPYVETKEFVINVMALAGGKSQ